MEDFKKFSLLKEGETKATDNTLPLSHSDNEPILEYTDPILAITPPCSQLDHSDKQGADIINYVRERQKEYHYGSHTYNALRNLEVVLPSFLQEYAQATRQRAIQECIDKLKKFTYPDADDFRESSGKIIESLYELKESSKK